MQPVSFPRRFALGLVVALAACGGNEPSGPPKVGPATKLVALTDLNRTATVGTTIANAIVVQVTDATGNAVPGISVAFAVTMGNGSTSQRVVSSDAKGQATVDWTLGTIAGPNEITANVPTIPTPVRFEATGTPGLVNTIVLTPQNARLLATVDTLRVSARSLDSFGNATSPAPALTPRDPSLVSVDTSGLLRALRRGSSTYVVASAGGKSDSVLVTVLASGQSICTAAATPMDLAVGQVVTDVSGSGFCVHASSDSSQYAIVPYYNSGVATATTQIEVLGQGLTPLVSTALAAPQPGALRIFRPAVPPLVPDYAFEARLRDRERQESKRLLTGAGAVEGLRVSRDLARANTAITVPNVGDVMQLNVNATDFCDNPDYRTGRVMAVTNNAIVVADTANPAGGFTSDEYRSIGVTFDTLVNPVDTAAFGAPSDIDNNGHVILFFTGAVNQLTTPGSGSVVLGFYYQRDLFPKTTAPGPCAGSNYGEMFYLMVPDTAGVYGNRLTKSQVITYTNGTVAHEYQHLINASRRMYVNGVGPTFEESWLDEGLAHTAEELNFWRASGLSPRSNLDASIFANPLGKVAVAFSTFENNNFVRYTTYLQRTETNGPVGPSATLQLRGAIWNFLRYAADHLVASGAVSNENAFWHSLVNSSTSGITNLTNVLGKSPNDMFRDWAISVFLDDDAPSIDPLFQQPSWNLRSALTNGGTSTTFPLFTRSLTDGKSQSVVLVGYGVSFLRFSVPSGQDALLTVTSGGQPLPSTIQLAVVRVR